MASVTQSHAEQAKKLKSKARASLALLLVAIISITTATYAWFTLSNSTSVQSMTVEVGTGTTLRAYADGGRTQSSTRMDDYFSVIRSEGGGGQTGENITNALPSISGVSLTSLGQIKLWPVTSTDGITLKTQGGNAVEMDKLYYLHLTLTFLSDTTMDVYLNGEKSASDKDDGTLVSAVTAGNQADENAVKALRISFEDVQEKTAVIYEPSGKNTVTGQTTFTDLGDNAGRHRNGDGGKPESAVLFHLVKDQPKRIVIRIWAEGEDPECINSNSGGINIEKGKVNVRLRFCGAGTDGKFMETAPR